MFRNNYRQTLNSDSSPSDDICPVCKSNRYLNPTLQFLINPECYHKMCSTCVDRLFTSGPAPCPVQNCGRTLRKKGFHKAFFQDLHIEKEVDIRKRVGAVFNRRQDEFETLRDWNDYLEEVEGLVFDLLEGGKEEKMAAERKLLRYKESNQREIEENKKQGMEETENERRRERVEREMAKKRRIEESRLEAEEKADLERSKRDVLERLASGTGDAEQITKEAHKIVLKKSSARRRLAMDDISSESAAAGESLTLRGLKKKVAPEKEKGYDAFGGVDLAPSRYVLRDDYECEWLDHAKIDQGHRAGGYSLHEYYSRTMFDAFAGLAVFVEDEVPNRSEFPVAPSAIGTGGAVEAAKGKIKVERKVESDDVF